MTQRTGLGPAAPQQPKLLSDQPRGARVGLVVAPLAGTFVLGHIVRYDYVAIYYNRLELWRPATAAYHHLIPNALWRHEGRYAVEGLYSGASVQVVFYNFARRWPPKPRCTEKRRSPPESLFPNPTPYDSARVAATIKASRSPWGKPPASARPSVFEMPAA